MRGSSEIPSLNKMSIIDWFGSALWNSLALMAERGLVVWRAAFIDFPTAVKWPSLCWPLCFAWLSWRLPTLAYILQFYKTCFPLTIKTLDIKHTFFIHLISISRQGLLTQGSSWRWGRDGWVGRVVSCQAGAGDRSVPDSSPCSHCSHQPGLVGDEALLCKDCQVRSDVIILSPSDIWLWPRLVVPVDSINPYKQLENIHNRND